MTTPTPKPRWYALTPARFFIGLLAVQVFLLLSERFQWFPFNEHKGWTVLIAVCFVVGAVVAMLVWGLVCLCLRRRFQFSVRSLLVFLVAVSVPLGWFTWELQKATQQREVVERIAEEGGDVSYDYEFGNSSWRYPAEPTTPAWLRKLFGDDFFCNVVTVSGGFSALGDNEARRLQELMNVEPHWPLNGSELERCRAVIESEFGNQLSLIKNKSIELDESDPEAAEGLRYLQSLTSPGNLYLDGTHVTDKGVKKLQQAWPNCKIRHESLHP